MILQTSPKNNTAISEMRFRLERNQTKLESLLDQLNSYKCEPTDYESFERLCGLRDAIDDFKKQHNKIYREFSSKGYGSQESLAKLMREEMVKFKKLNQNISEYVLDTVAQ